MQGFMVLLSLSLGFFSGCSLIKEKVNNEFDDQNIYDPVFSGLEFDSPCAASTIP
jgi:hypothetical protein